MSTCKTYLHSVLSRNIEFLRRYWKPFCIPLLFNIKVLLPNAMSAAARKGFSGTIIKLKLKLVNFHHFNLWDHSLHIIPIGFKLFPMFLLNSGLWMFSHLKPTTACVLGNVMLILFLQSWNSFFLCNAIFRNIFSSEPFRPCVSYFTSSSSLL